MRWFTYIVIAAIAAVVLLVLTGHQDFVLAIGTDLLLPLVGWAAAIVGWLGAVAMFVIKSLGVMFLLVTLLVLFAAR